MRFWTALLRSRLGNGVAARKRGSVLAVAWLDIRWPVWTKKVDCAFLCERSDYKLCYLLNHEYKWAT